jgi:hypothetical protein
MGKHEDKPRATIMLKALNRFNLTTNKTLNWHKSRDRYMVLQQMAWYKKELVS